MTRESALYASGAYEGICGETPELLVNMIFDYFEAQLKAKDDEIRRLNNLYADTIKDLGDALIEIERLKEIINTSIEEIEYAIIKPQYVEVYLNNAIRFLKEQQ